MRRTIREQLRVDDERREMLLRLEDWLETPLWILGFVWLALLVIEFIWGISPLLETASTVIWIIFFVDFAVKLTLAPAKFEYLKKNWLTAISLAIPALRVFRIFRVVRVFRAARVARGLRLVRVLTSLNRGMKSLSKSLGRRGFGYVVGLSLLVLFGGAAGMFAFENETPNGLQSYGEALWWTAMLLTSIGSDFFPQTAEGRVLCFMLALYGFCVFGYVTATLATFFVERDAESKDSAIAAARQIENLQIEIKTLRDEIRTLSEHLKK